MGSAFCSSGVFLGSVELQLNQLSGREFRHRLRNARGVRLQFGPARMRQNQERDIATSKTLLMPQLFIGRDQHVELFVSVCEQLSVRQLRPANLKRSDYLVLAQIP